MNTFMNRRQFIKTSGAGVAALSSLQWRCGSDVPAHLEGYEDLYKTDPKKASIQWFREAKFGLFIHYGLYSLLGRHEWVLYNEKIPIAEYDKLKEKFTAENFDADFITDLALEAEMKYINLVTKHCDSFCLWNTDCTDFNSINSPAKRDLVAEMAAACHKKGLGFFAFYEHGFDWRHPHGPSPWDWSTRAVRPHYDPPEPSYAYGDEYDFQIYLDYVNCGITELLTQYGSLAGLWLDGAAVPASGDHTKFKLDELYTMINELQPQALISYKWGITGGEDFFAPERPQLERLAEEDLVGKPMEICTSLHDGGSTGKRLGWGYVADSKHMTADHVLNELEYANSRNANLLLNTGPLPDGSIHPVDIKTLKEVGKILRSRV